MHCSTFFHPNGDGPAAHDGENMNVKTLVS
jgi:hypothetical protein